jgi:hypothetical protein
MTAIVSPGVHFDALMQSEWRSECSENQRLLEAIVAEAIASDTEMHGWDEALRHARSRDLIAKGMVA